MDWRDIRLSLGRRSLSPFRGRNTNQDTSWASALKFTTDSAQRVEEAPLVKTKAKMNNTLLKGSASDFGMDSIYERSTRRQCQAFSDADVPSPTPPTIYPPSSTPIHQGRCPSSKRTPFSARLPENNATRAPTPAPPIRKGSTSSSLSTPQTNTASPSSTSGPSAHRPDLNTELLNRFRIRYFDPADAMCAVRKILGRSWMVGVKWADPALRQSPSSANWLPERGRHTVDVSHRRTPVLSMYASHRDTCDRNFPQARAVRFGFSQGGEPATYARAETTAVGAK